MTDAPRSNEISPVVFMGSGGPDLTSPEHAEWLAEKLMAPTDRFYLGYGQNAAATLRALSTVAESNQQMAQSWQACAEIAGAERDKEYARAEALDAKLKEAVNVMQAWKTAGTDQDYYQAVQKRNAFLASLEGDKP